jgi:hypothetical protein
MPIKRSPYQSEKTLEEFYNRKEWKGAFKIISSKMLKLVDWINENFVETELTAFTSHQRLCIQDKNDENLNWIIRISNYIMDQYYIEYKIPKNKGPWDEAMMSGIAEDFEESIIYLIKSMNESEVWKGNNELIKLTKKYGIRQSN